MDGSAIKELERIVNREPQPIEINGETYTTAPIYSMADHRPQPEPLLVHTLTGFVDYVREDIDKLHEKPAMIHVVDETLVELASALQDYQQRDRFLQAKWHGVDWPGTRDFFSSFHTVESFVIGMQSLFVENEDRARLLSLVGNVVAGQALTTEDDGVTQRVQVKAGIQRLGLEKVRNPFRLKPYRTFLEIDQPESDFILRLKPKGEDETPACALFEADGGLWKLEAVKRIAEYLKEGLSDALVIVA